LKYQNFETKYHTNMNQNNTKLYQIIHHFKRNSKDGIVI